MIKAGKLHVKLHCKKNWSEPSALNLWQPGFWGIISMKKTKGAFHSTKTPVWNCGKFHVPNGMVHSGCTDLTQAIAHLVIVHVIGIQKSFTGDNNFVKWEGTFRSHQLKWPDWSKWTTFKAGPKYFGWTKWSVPFNVPTKISRILGWVESALSISSCAREKLGAWGYRVLLEHCPLNISNVPCKFASQQSNNTY